MQHPELGEGLVLRDIRDGNHELEIQLPSGIRTIPIRFVTDAVDRVA